MSRQDDDRKGSIRVLDVLDALAGFAVSGVSNSTLARQLGLAPSAITRAIDTLIEKGWARKDESTGHFHPTPRMGQVFGRVLADFDRAEQRLIEARQRFTRN